MSAPERKYLLSKRARREIGRRTRKALRAKIARGERVSYIAPFGMSFDHTGQRTIPNLAEQATIKRIIELRSEGKAILAICRILMNEGRPAKRSENWNPRTAKNILRRAGVK